MDEQTALVFALQLVALFSIAGALLVYLLCKIRATPEPESGVATIGGGKSVIVTSCDTAVGLQLALHLSNRGFRVFAGLKEGTDDSMPAKILRSWQKEKQGTATTISNGSIVILPLDVTREDILHEAVDIMRAHLPAGEDGVSAVVNTSSVSYRGRLDQQDIGHWDAMFKTNVIGLLRTIRTFQSFLRNTKGRLITLGASDSIDTGSVACTATRYAVEGASEVLRKELAPFGIKVVTLHPKGITADVMFSTPKQDKSKQNETAVEISGGSTDFYPKVLSTNALQQIEVALTCREPKQTYTLSQNTFWSKRLEVVLTLSPEEVGTHHAIRNVQNSKTFRINCKYLDGV